MKEQNNLSIYRELIIDFFSQRLNPVVIYIYGSVLGCGFNNESDIDIAVIADSMIDSTALYYLSADLSVVLKRDVHIVDFLAATDVLRIEILRKRKIYSAEMKISAFIMK